MFYKNQKELVKAQLADIEKRIHVLRNTIYLSQSCERNCDFEMGECTALMQVRDSLGIVQMGAIFEMNCIKDLPKESKTYLERMKDIRESRTKKLTK